MKRRNLLLYLTAVSALAIFISGCDPDAPAPPSSLDAKSILTFVFPADANDALSEDAAATITDFSITVVVPDDTDLRNLKPEIIYDAEALHPGNLVARDFSNPVSYIVMAADGTTSLYTVSVAHESEVAALKSITSFVFKAANNPTLSTDKTGTIGSTTVTATVPYGTDVSALVPSIVHTGKSIVPVNESARSFYTPQTYTVTAGDGTAAAYTVTVNISNPPGSVSLIETGQSTSYATGDDGDHRAGTAWPSPRFTDNGNNTVTDNATGLVWDKYPSNTLTNWEDALAYCNGRILGGAGDWRMPNINELESLVNYNEDDQAAWLNSQGFSGFQQELYWSSTTYTASDTNAFVYNIPQDTILTDGKGNFNYVVPVRGVSTVIAATGQTDSFSATGGEDGDLQAGVAWPSPRFTVSGNVITDNLTGLQWEQAPTTSTMLWAAAVQDGNNLDLGGFDDWRLPNIRELRTLTNFGETDSSLWLESQGFADIVSSQYYYCSTTESSDSFNALGYIVSQGISAEFTKTANSDYLMHVRAGD